MALNEYIGFQRGPAVVHRILLVEDDQSTAECTKLLLEKQGYRVEIARDGGQAQSSFVMHKPDFVIMDLILPRESGFEVCERFKQTDESIPVMVVSAIDMQDSRDLAVRVGADDYLCKPVEPEVLLERIRAVSEAVWERSHLGRSREEKKVRFSCPCGKRFKVRASHRGKSLSCPECGQPLTVPRHD